MDILRPSAARGVHSFPVVAIRADRLPPGPSVSGSGQVAPGVTDPRAPGRAAGWARARPLCHGSGGHLPRSRVILLPAPRSRHGAAHSAALIFKVDEARAPPPGGIRGLAGF